MSSLLKKITAKQISRRTFLAATAAGTAGLALSGCSNVLSTVGADYDAAAVGAEGKWITAACWHNCGGRCLNKALVVDGVVVRQKTDDTHPDSPDYPQQRACPRGRSQQQQVLGADRLKYPMKRKNWEPGGGKKELRGRDEWVRISWEEALDHVAGELKKTKENYGDSSILVPEWGPTLTPDFCDSYEVLKAFCNYTGVEDTASFGTYHHVSSILGLPALDMGSANDRLDLRKSETIVLYGCNPAWSSAGSPAYHFRQAQKAGARYIYVGPSYNESANLLDAKWIRVRPGTDTAFLLSVAYTMIAEDDPLTNPIIDWDFLNRCTVGFDAEHMPANAALNENFRDYALGNYDGQPKTPEWAAEICGTPIEDIRWYAREMRKDKKVSILHSYAPARCNNADNFPQIFMTIGAMGGHMGKPGHSCGSTYHAYAGNSGPALVAVGKSGQPRLPISRENIITGPELWEAILNGKYKHTANIILGDLASVQERPIDIRVIYHSSRNSLTTIVGLNKAIEAHRKVDFVVAQAFSLNDSAKYADIVLPITTQWERAGEFKYLSNSNREILIFPSQVIEPLYEAQSDQWIGLELAKRLGLNEQEVHPFSDEQRYFNLLSSTQVINKEGTGYEPLVTITDSDIAKWGVNGTPQQGRISLEQLLEQGIYQVERREGDPYGYIAYQKFVEDPEHNPLRSKSGKLEIYCQEKADRINAMGRSVLKPYANYIEPLNGYEQSFSDWNQKRKGDYPFQITNPHYLRRGHTALDNIPWLRESFPNPVFINEQDALAKSIKDGDTVLIYNQYGKVLRQASLSQRLMPGYLELPHGCWTDIDEATGINSGGTDNTLCAPATSGQGVSGYNTNLVNFEKYEGKPLIPDHMKPQRVINI